MVSYNTTIKHLKQNAFDDARATPVAAEATGMIMEDDERDEGEADGIDIPSRVFVGGMCIEAPVIQRRSDCVEKKGKKVLGGP